MNTRIAAWSMLLLLATSAGGALIAGPIAGEAPTASLAGLGWLRGHALTLPGGLPTGTIGLIVNEGVAEVPLVVEPAAAGRPARAWFANGAGSGDLAHALIGEERFAVDVRTPTGMLTAPRFFAGAASDGDVAYILGGATNWRVFPEQWVLLDSIIRVDLASGEVRTMAARLPEPVHSGAVAWWPTRTAACPSGCAYLFGGVDASGAASSRIVRYDPVGDVATVIPATLPLAASRLTPLVTQDAVVLFGAMSALIVRFDPVRETVAVRSASPLAVAADVAAVFDPRPRAECPTGCGYLFGGRHDAAAAQPGPRIGRVGDHTRADVFRFEPRTNTLTPIITQLPEPRASVTAVWAGEYAVLYGGLSCDGLLCDAPPAVLRFDPFTNEVRELAAPAVVLTREAAGVWHRGDVVLLTGVMGAPGQEGAALDQLVRYPVR